MAEDRLPRPLTSFFGREDEVLGVARALEGHRLVTLAGPGGVGKTRLAIEAARTAAQAFPEGVWFVDLSPVRDGDGVPVAIRAALGAPEAMGDPTTALIDLIDDRGLLLVLDNCEQVIEVVASLAGQLVQSCPQVVLVATSREPLGVPAERTWRVLPLSLPPGAEQLGPSALGELPVVQLFLERAQLANPSFELTVATAPPVVRICSAVDCLPLAVELAAAHVRSFPVTQVAQRLADRLPMLTGGARTSPGRQRTMEAAIRWSYDLLTEPQQRLFRRLAGFIGGWTLEAAEGICAFDGIAQGDVLSLLEDLVDRSLVVPSPEADGRFCFLEVILEFARNELVTSGEAEAVGSRHCRWFASLAARAEPHLPGRSGLFWMEAMTPEQDNFSAALDWAEEHPADLDAGLALAGDLRWFWTDTAHSASALARVHRLLGAASQGSTAAMARLLISAAWFADMGSAEARSHAEQAVVLAGELNDDRLLGLAFECVSRGALGNLAVSEMRAAATEAVRLARRVGDSSLEVRSLVHLAIADEEDGDVEAAAHHLRRALELAEGADLRELALVLNCMGDHARLLNDFEAAEGWYRRGLDAARARGSHRLVLMTTLNLGATLALVGRQDARQVLRDALELGLRLGDHAFVVEGLRGSAALEAAKGDAAFAARLLGAADTHYGGAPTQAPDRPLRDLAFDTARARLGDRFDREYEAGKRLGVTAGAREVLLAAPPAEVVAAPTRPAGLSPREVEILRLVAAGASNQAIADRLVLSRRTVENHVANAYTKIGATNRIEAVRFAIDHGLVASPLA